MSFTRIRDDPARIMKQAQISSMPGRYNILVPGQGIDLPFIEDPHVRLEKWGANAMTNLIGTENYLKGISNHLNHDCLNVNEYTRLYPQNTEKIDYRKIDYSITDETRSSCPAFQFRDVEISRWEEPFLNPQANFEIPFHTNLQTRIIEKDAIYGANSCNMYNREYTTFDHNYIHSNNFN
jgi:hypothetical protein